MSSTKASEPRRFEVIVGGRDASPDPKAEERLAGYFERAHALWLQALNDPAIAGVDHEDPEILRRLARGSARAAGLPVLSAQRGAS
jgi:hypothetical protein